MPYHEISRLKLLSLVQRWENQDRMAKRISCSNCFRSVEKMPQNPSDFGGSSLTPGGSSSALHSKPCTSTSCFRRWVWAMASKSHFSPQRSIFQQSCSDPYLERYSQLFSIPRTANRSPTQKAPVRLLSVGMERGYAYTFEALAIFDEA